MVCESLSPKAKYFYIPGITAIILTIAFIVFVAVGASGICQFHSHTINGISMECGRCGDGSIEDIYCRGCGGGIGSSYACGCIGTGLANMCHSGAHSGAIAMIVFGVFFILIAGGLVFFMFKKHPEYIKSTFGCCGDGEE